MRIQGTNAGNKAGGAKKANGSQKAGGSNFDSYLSQAGGVSQASQTEQTADVSGVNPLLMLQEVDEREAGRKQALKKGAQVLQYLDEVRHSLLLGRLPLDVVSDLHKSVDNWRERTDDPTLNEILDDIELRAAVELAKIEKGREKRSRTAS